MRNVYSILFLILIPFLGSTQQQELNVSLNKLNAHTEEDTVRLNLLNDIGYIYKDISPLKGLQTTDEAIELAKKLRNTEKLAVAYFYKGMNYSALSQSSNALKMYNNAIKIYNRKNLLQKTASIYNAMGVAYTNLSDGYNAMECYFKALAIYESVNDQNGKADEYCNISLIHNMLGNYREALKYLENAYSLYKINNDEKGMINTLGNAGNSYLKLGDKTKALKLYQKAFAISKKINFKNGIANSSTSIANIYNEENNFDASLENYKNSLRLFKELNDEYNESLVLCAIGNLYSKVSSSSLPKNNFGTTDRLLAIEDCLSRSLALADSTGNVPVQASAWQQISELDSIRGDYFHALQAFQKYLVFKDSISNQNKKQQITQLEMKYDFDKKTTLYAAELNRQRIIKNSVMASSGFLLLTGFSGFAFYRRNKQKKEAEFKTIVIDTEMKALRAQMNPHFIFNSLSSIADYINKNQTEIASDFTTKFAKLMRMVLENSEQREIPLAEDLKALELYMQLESLRLKNKFTYNIKVDESIDKENTLVPPLILQPFVENSIWHGISKKEGYGNIIISIKQENGMINCIVDDDGGGLIIDEPVNEEKKKSLGMKITKARIDIINKLKNANASINVSNKENGVRAEVKLPLALSF